MSELEEKFMEAEQTAREALMDMKVAADNAGMDFRERLDDLIDEAENQ